MWMLNFCGSSIYMLHPKDDHLAQPFLCILEIWLRWMIIKYIQGCMNESNYRWMLGCTNELIYKFYGINEYECMSVTVNEWTK